MIMKRIAFFFIALILSGITFGHAWWGNNNQDEWRNKPQPRNEYQQASFKPQVQIPQFQSKLDIFIADFTKGAILGDAIAKPNFANIVGQITAGLSPAGVATDIRDFSINISKSVATGFQEHKKETVMAGFGFLPFLGEAKNAMKAWKVGREEKALAKAERLLSDIGVAAPPTTFRGPFVETGFMNKLPTEVNRMFQGGAKPQTFGPGKAFYQPLVNESNQAVSNSRFFLIEPPKLGVAYRKFELDTPATFWVGHTKRGLEIYNAHQMPPHAMFRTIKTDLGIY